MKTMDTYYDIGGEGRKNGGSTLDREVREGLSLR